MFYKIKKFKLLSYVSLNLLNFTWNTNYSIVFSYDRCSLGKWIWKIYTFRVYTKIFMVQYNYSNIKKCIRYQYGLLTNIKFYTTYNSLKKIIMFPSIKLYRCRLQSSQVIYYFRKKITQCHMIYYSNGFFFY